MLKVYITASRGIITGCPEKGFPALDFRRRNHIPDDATNRFLIPEISGYVCEPIVRALAAQANDSLDIHLEVYEQFFEGLLGAPFFELDAKQVAEIYILLTHMSQPQALIAHDITILLKYMAVLAEFRETVFPFFRKNREEEEIRKDRERMERANGLRPLSETATS